MTEPIKFQFTRHALSCNNVELGSNLAGKDFEPSITDHALLQLTNNPNGNSYYNIDDDYYLRHKNSDVISNNKDDNKLLQFNFDRFNQNTVHNHLYILVSPLIRTWETAVVLYGIGNPYWQIMNLYIGPHLKEFVKEVKVPKITITTLKTGNFYESPEKIIPKFKNFLEILLKNNHESMINSNGKKIILHWPQFKGFNIKTPKFIKFTFTINGKVVDVTSLCKELGDDLSNSGNYYVEYDDVDKKDESGYFKSDGNLQKFMELFNDIENYNDNDNGYPSKLIINNTVHVVTHSNVMQEYIKEIYGYDMKNNIPNKLDKVGDNDKKKQLYLIKNSNNWTFTESYKEIKQGNKNEEQLISDLNMQLGVPSEYIQPIKIIKKLKDYVYDKYGKGKNYNTHKRELCGSDEENKINSIMTCNRLQSKNKQNNASKGGKRKSRKLKKSKKRRKNYKTRKNKKY
tara:strand:+ start:1801 stop:3171 length:1371 start_codon:yes stop_codon:yes gene_type:complete